MIGFSTTPRQLESTQMTSNVDNKSGNKNVQSTSKHHRKLMDTGWTRIPNAFKFEMEITKFDPDWMSLGIEKKLPAKKMITPYINAKMTRYMLYQIKRLKKIQKNEEGSRFWQAKYWKVVRKILLRSNVFRVSAIHHVLPNWYCDYPYWTIIMWNRKVTKIFQKWDDQLLFRRVYIPKGDTDYRPLGVPTVEWRIALHMFSCFLQMFTRHLVLDTQHGFIPRRGTLTAWRAIFKKVINAKYIYECDLRQFFPSVKLDSVMGVLRDNKLPWGEWFWLKGVNLNQPKLPKKLLLDESRYQQEQITKEIDAFMYNWFQTHPDLKGNFIEKDSMKWLLMEQFCLQAVKEKFGKTPQEFREEWNRTADNPDGDFLHTGVPQGAPTSPWISILTLKKFLTQAPSISYADDPIFYSNKDFKIEDSPEDGIKLNWEKSRWIRRNGIWSESLKYLGLKYNPLNNSLYGNTRKGSKLKFTPEFRDKILKKFAPNKPLNWNSIFELPDAGMLLSRLYIGSWSSDEIKQDFRLTYKKKSLTWLLKRGHRNPLISFEEEHNVFNISSIASNLLCTRLTYSERRGIRSPRYYYLRRDKETRLRDTSNPRPSFVKLLYK